MTAETARTASLYRATHTKDDGTISSGQSPLSERRQYTTSLLGQLGDTNMQEDSALEDTISIAVDPVALITTECITVTSAMRKNARWAQSSVSAILGGGGALDSGRHSRMPDHLKRSSVHSKSTSQSSKGGGNLLEEEDALTSRWGLRGKKGKSMQDNPLMSAFARLRSDLRGCKDVRTFDSPSLLHPFLQVIRSSSTSASITSLAIVAITKFFAYNLIARDSPRLPLAMQLLSAAITHCRFEASDSAADEIVLLQILQLMESMLSGPGGDLLGDESVCEMMETGLSMCCQSRLSELVRRSAEMSMVKMCQIIFERLKTLELEAGEEVDHMDLEQEDQAAPIMMEPTINGTEVSSKSIVANGAALPVTESLQDVATPTSDAEAVRFDGLPNGNGHEEVTSKIQDTNEKSSEPNSKKNSLDSEPQKPQKPQKPRDMIPPRSESTAEISRKVNKGKDEPINIKPYSLPSIRELFRVLVDLLQPHSRQHSDALRVMALRIIDVALEVAGPSIAKHPSLANLAKDDLCRYLFQLVRSENIGILNESLRVAGTLLTTCREVLKLQQELFLSYLVACLHPQVEIPDEPGIDPALYDGVPKTPKLVKPMPSQSTSGRSTPVPIKERQRLGMEGGSRKPDAREAMVESIGALSRIPSFLVELYINFDCEVDRSDLCEDLVGLLSRNAFPDSATWSTTNVPPLSLDSLLGYVQFIADRLDDPPVTQGYPDIEKLRYQRSRKKIIVKGATKFNENPRAGIAFLASHGIIDDPDDPRQVAKFLKGTTRVSKGVLGEFLSKKNNESLLGAFLDLFDFTEQRVDEALRDLLNSFRLPGESPLIERIVTVFSQKYCANSTPEGIADEDAVFTLTYSIIMLNTDQHNPNVKNEKRMTINDFMKNLRGVNGGGDFAAEYLQEIYKSIKTNEIILPDEHNNKQAFDYAWEGLLVKAATAGTLTMCDTNIFDADMFAATWKPIVATLSYVFMSASDDAVFSRVVLGFDQCAQIASKYGNVDALDHIIFCLGRMSTLATDKPMNTALNTEVQVEQDSVMLSELAVKFGRDYKAQLACTVLFRHLLPEKEHNVHAGWKHIVRIWVNLFANSLLPVTFSQSQSLLEISPIPLQPPVQVIDRAQRGNESGLLSSFTSYLSSYAADDPPEPSEEELESTLCTIDCLSICPLEDSFKRILARPTESRRHLVQALLGLLPEQSSPVVMPVKPDQPRPTPIRTSGTRNKADRSKYDPSIVFILELVTILSTKDADSVESIGQPVADVLQNIVRDSANIHPLVFSRAVFYLLYMLEASQDHSFLRAPVILHTISSYDQSMLETAEEYLARGLAICMRKPSPLKNEMTNTPDFWLLLRSFHNRPAVAGGIFEILTSIIEAKPAGVTADNYENAISVLNGFASAGSIGAAIEQQRDRRSTEHSQDKRSQKRAKSPRKASKEYVTSLESFCAIADQHRESAAVERGQKAVTLIFHLTSRVPSLIERSHLERKEAWITYWSPIFQALRTQCLNPCRQIRHQAFLSLQNSLLSPGLASQDHQEWTAIFGEVLFPLITRLLKPEVFQTDPIGMSETRVQASRLLCNIFLHYLVLLSEWDGMLDLWLKILEIMDRLMNSGQGDNLEEAVPESLKNILLVMADGGYLEAPKQGESPSELWAETYQRVERFLPGLFKSLFPPPPPPAATPAGGQAGETKVADNKPGHTPSTSTGEAASRTSADAAPAPPPKGESVTAKGGPPPVEPSAKDVD